MNVQNRGSFLSKNICCRMIVLFCHCFFNYPIIDLGKLPRVYMFIYLLYRWPRHCDLPVCSVCIAGCFSQERKKGCNITYTRYFAVGSTCSSTGIYLFFDLCVFQKCKLISNYLSIGKKGLLMVNIVWWNCKTPS